MATTSTIQLIPAQRRALDNFSAALKIGCFLTYNETRDEYPLPQAVAGIDGLQGLKYVKGKDKVLLVRPPNGIPGGSSPR